MVDLSSRPRRAELLAFTAARLNVTGGLDGD